MVVKLLLLTIIGITFTACKPNEMINDGETEETPFIGSVITEYPEKLSRFSSVQVGDNLYLAGGENSEKSGYSKSFWKYNLVNKEWTQLLSMPIGKVNGSLVHLNGRIAYVGGSDFNSLKPDILIYNPIQNTWSTIANSFPINLEDVGRYSIVSDGKKVFAVSSSKTSKTIKVFESNNLTNWTVMEFSDSTGHEPLLTISNQKVYITYSVLGFNPKTFFEYDIQTKKLTQLSRPNNGTRFWDAVIWSDENYIYKTGNTYELNNIAPEGVPHFEKYHMSSGVWESVVIDVNQLKLFENCDQWLRINQHEFYLFSSSPHYYSRNMVNGVSYRSDLNQVTQP